MVSTRVALAGFWADIAAKVPPAPLAELALAPLVELARHFSPALLNPLDINPLRDVIAARIDFERLRAACPLRLFVAATHASSGRLRVFRTQELGVDVLAASCCLPSLQRPVEIDGEAYWDGAFAANPAVFPLVYECAAADVMLVLLSPLEHGPGPRSAAEIRERIAQIAFDANFLREMASLARLRAFAGASWFALGRLERRLRRLRFHLITAEGLLSEFGPESRLLARASLLEQLRDRGRAHADRWLECHRAQLGRVATVDIAAMFG